MGRQHKSKSFAEIVRDVEQSPAPPTADRSGVVDPSGKRWHQHLVEISPSRARDLAHVGAAVAWDPCGCGGYCGFDWFTPAQVAAMVASGTPKLRRTKRHHGNISEWRTAEGDVLVVAEDAVQWGGILG